MFLLDSSKIVSLIVGVSLDYKPKSLLNHLQIFLNFCFIFTFAFSSIYTTWTFSPDFSQMINYLIPISGSGYLVFSSFWYLFKSGHLLRFNRQMKRISLSVNSAAEAKIIANSMKIMPIVKNLFFLLLSICMLEAISTPGITTLIEFLTSEAGDPVTLRLPYLLKIPLVPLYSVKYLILAYGIMVAIYTNYYDVICFGMCLQLRGHFKVIQRRFRQLNFQSTSFKQELKKLILYQNEIFEALNEFHRGFEPIAVILFLGIAVILCGIFYVITQVNKLNFKRNLIMLLGKDFKRRFMHLEFKTDLY